MVPRGEERGGFVAVPGGRITPTVLWRRKKTEWEVEVESQEQAVEQRLERADPATLRKVVVGVGLGNFMEWFDFGLYGYLATTLAIVFFPSEDPAVGLLATFAVFGVAFVVRPLGGLILGPLGDKIGRQRLLAGVIILMALSTFSIGFLPGYASIGIWAPILLVLARAAQGLSASAEFGGGATFLAEYSPEERRGFFVSFLQFSSLIGFGSGLLLVQFLSFALSEDALVSWGWRIPFLLAGPLGLIGLYIRLRLEDTPEFRALENAGQVSQTPFRETITQNWREILQVGGIAILQNVAFYLVLTYVQTYVIQLGYPRASATLSTALTILLTMALLPLLGAFSDRNGRKPLLIASSVGFALLSYPLFWFMSTGGLPSVVLGHMALGVLLALFISVNMTVLVELLPTRVRVGGFSIGYNISVAIFTGPAAALSTYLISVTGNQAAPAFYIIFAAVLSLVTILTIRETAGTPLRHTQPQPREA
jgi:MHS family proline/betaine transporter-like MFS transporter